MKKSLVISFVFICAFFSSQLSREKKIRHIKRKISSVETTSCLESIKKLNFNKKTFKDLAVQKQLESSFASCLSEYIQIKTISPKGDEHKAVDFLESIFHVLDIPFKRFLTRDLNSKKNYYRSNFVATLSEQGHQFDWSQKQKRHSIILLHHMDVVSVKEDQWEDPFLAFSGKIMPDESGEDYIWGRGALDMKGIAMAQLFSMIILKKMKTKLTRDIHFLAVADEEQGASGAIGAIRKMEKAKELYALSSANLVLNEGGAGFQNIPKEEHDIFLIAAEEKGGAWLEFVHKKPTELINNLVKSGIVDLKRYVKKRDKKKYNINCHFERIFTPKAKVNILASKLDLTLKCDKEYPILKIKEVFLTGFERYMSLNIVKKDKIYDLSLNSKSSGHGSVSFGNSVFDVLAASMYRMKLLKKRKYRSIKELKYIKTPATNLLMKKLSKTNGMLGFLNKLSFIPLVKKMLYKGIEDGFGVNGLFKTSCQLSALNFNLKSNAAGWVDCRLVHTFDSKIKNHANVFIAQLKKVIKDNRQKINLLEGWDFSRSPVKTKDFKIIIKTLEKDKLKTSSNRIHAMPYLFPAGSDSTWFRNPYSAGADVKPIACYGFHPIYLTPKVIATNHGANERYPVQQILPTILRYNQVLRNLLQNESKILQRIRY
ncbi:MAG: M20/M25/M40 family metallo-hydrolase [Bacteriovoracaceae bacterium]|nr:M20/M25/M40 family metallo-hydrolase [Bacteriovoracaceae bacterium]